MTQRLHTRSQHISPYPGVRNPYNERPGQAPPIDIQPIPETTPATIDAMAVEAASIIPFQNPTPEPQVLPPAGKAKSSFSMNDIKGFIDRMGGIDGIVTTMGKVQKVMQSVSQMAPMMKLMADTLLPGKKKNDDEEEDLPIKRRRRKRRKSTSKSGSKQKAKARKRPISSKR